jgi:peptidoglycan lytic transglycosylase D
MVVGALFLLMTTSCESSSKKRAAAKPPVQAQAPAVKPPTPAPKQVPARAKAPAPSAPVPEKKSSGVDLLIAQVEKQYQQGRSEYDAGHLESAKSSFDQAVDMLLTSPFDIHANEQLQNEFDKVVEGINQLEMVALKEGDGFTEQQTVPAPIAAANEVTFPVDPNIKARAEQQIKVTVSDLPLVVNDFVAGYINYFNTRGRGTLEQALTRAGRYREMIQTTFREEGVPQDLMYLAQAESGFQPLALNPSGARGMWQFMASRAAGYGLQRSWWIDERQDPVKSTRAAARHLKDLYNQFGDWYLAMAAYDSGPGNVQQAVRRTGYADFWELYKRNVLPKETKNYVPIILAYAIMSKNAAQYGLDKLQPASPTPTEAVRVNYPVDLRLVAECVDAPVEKLIELNPSLLRLTTPKDSSFDLRLPGGSREKYLSAIAAIPADKRVFWRYHTVDTGESLSAIAHKYRTSTQAIAEVNNLQHQDLKAESKLIIPVAPTNSRAASGKVSYSRAPTRYRVRKGDTVLSIADDFGVPPEKLRGWNRLKGNEVHSGKLLVIYRPVSPSAQATAINRPLVSHSAKRRSRKASHTSAKAAQKASSATDSDANGKKSPPTGKSNSAASLR